MVVITSKLKGHMHKKVAKNKKNPHQFLKVLPPVNETNIFRNC